MNSNNENNYPSWNPKTVWEIGPDEIFAINIENQRRITLNPEASEIWIRCDGTKTVEKISTDLSEEFDVPLNSMKNNVQVFVEKMLSRQFLEVTSVPYQKTRYLPNKMKKIRKNANVLMRQKDDYILLFNLETSYLYEIPLKNIKVWDFWKDPNTIKYFLEVPEVLNRHILLAETYGLIQLGFLHVIDEKMEGKHHEFE